MAHLPSVLGRYEHIMAWFEQLEVMDVRFEDLILSRESTIHAMIDHLEASGYRIPVTCSEAVQRVVQAIDPHKSPAFRKCSIGDWREYFTPEHKRLLREVAGDLLVRLGYEERGAW